MKKIALVIGGLIVAIILTVPFLVSVVVLPNIGKESYGGLPNSVQERKEYVFTHSEPWEQSKGKMKYYGYKVPSNAELKQLKKSIDLTRRYPETIKAVFSPGPVPNTTELLFFSDELARIGVNTYWVIGEYRIENNKAKQFMPGFNQAGLPSVLEKDDAEKMLAWRILLAKKAGFATILIPDFPSAFNIGRENFNIAKLKLEFERVALELAKMAEEYQAEYLSPVNEYDHMLISNGYSIDEIARLEKEFYDEITPKIRAVYKGKVVYKTGNIGEWSNFPKLSMKGADMFGVGNAYTGGAEMTAKDETEKVQAADLVSERDNVPWIESEFLVYRPIDQENWMGRVESTYPMEMTYKEGTRAFESNEQRAVGFTFMSWTGVGRIRGTAAAGVMEDFFERWQPTPKVIVKENMMDVATDNKQSVSIKDWIINLPKYYAVAFNLLAGKMGPQKETPFGEEALDCKTKEECDAFCAKPENRDTCTRFRGEQEGPGQSGQDREEQNRRGPGGCRSETECREYCDKEENRDECLKFKDEQNEERR